MDSSKTRPRRRPTREEPKKFFTLEHANRTLPLVRRIVEDVVAQYQVVVDAQRRSHELPEKATPEQRRIAEDASHAAVEKLRSLAEELADIGCELKDWATGLIDFPSIREGREVYLCWRLGEPAVAYWHELDTGYNGRQAVETVANS